MAENRQTAAIPNIVNNYCQDVLFVTIEEEGVELYSANEDQEATA